MVEKNNDLQITVWDTGIEMASKGLENYFNPSNDSKMQKLQNIPGTGLGLNLSKEPCGITWGAYLGGK